MDADRLRRGPLALRRAGGGGDRPDEFGTALGTLAGALAGRVESLVMRLVDVLLAIPSLLLSLTVIILFGFGTLNAMVAVGVGRQ